MSIRRAASCTQLLQERSEPRGARMVRALEGDVAVVMASSTEGCPEPIPLQVPSENEEPRGQVGAKHSRRMAADKDPSFLGHAVHCLLQPRSRCLLTCHARL